MQGEPVDRLTGSSYLSNGRWTVGNEELKMKNEKVAFDLLVSYLLKK